MNESYRRFCVSASQHKNLDAVIKYGSNKKAAAALGINRRSIDKSMKIIKNRAIKHGYAPDHDMTHTAPDGFTVAGTSTLYDLDGNQRLQWVKTKADGCNSELMHDAIVDGLLNSLDGQESKPVKKPEKVYENMLSVYPMGDPHIGMYCWSQESGADFNVEIATEQLTDAMRRLVATSPPSKYALIVNLGDFFHSDNLRNETKSGNKLDVDTRISRVWELGMTALITCIDEAKKKHEFVTVRNEIGNHDDHTSMLLSLAMDAWYKNDDRVIIDRSPAKFFYMKFGKNLIGTTHGDTIKMNSLAGIMAADQPENWGKTIHRYWYTGHFHSSKVEEYPGVLVEQFRTLAAKDAWTASRGYRSGRDMRLIVLHRENGEIERHRVDIHEIEV
jgi:hypothetical protein